LYNPLLLVEVEGPTTLSIPLPPPSKELPVDAAVVYESNRFCTLVDDQCAAALGPLEDRLASISELGTDFPSASARTDTNIRSLLYSLRRAKDTDEAAMIRCAFEATELAYQYPFETLREGITEVELFAGMQAVIA